MSSIDKEQKKRPHRCAALESILRTQTEHHTPGVKDALEDLKNLHL